MTVILNRTGIDRQDCAFRTLRLVDNRMGCELTEDCDERDHVGEGTSDCGLIANALAGDQRAARELLSALATLVSFNFPDMHAHQRKYLCDALMAIARGADPQDAFHIRGKADRFSLDQKIMVVELMTQLTRDASWSGNRSVGGIVEAAREVARIVNESATEAKNIANPWFVFKGYSMTPMTVRKWYFEKQKASNRRLCDIVGNRRHDWKSGKTPGSRF